MIRLLRYLLGHSVQTERELLALTNADDLTVPVTRWADRQVYEMPAPGDFTLQQLRELRLGKDRQ